MKVYLGCGENRRAGASLSHHHRKTFRSNYSGHLSASLESSDMRQLDLQQVRRMFLEHRKRVFGGTNALLSGDGDRNRAPEIGETLQIAARQRLLGIGDMKPAELRQNFPRIAEGISGIAIDSDRRLCANRVSHCADPRYISLPISTADFDFEGMRAIARKLIGAHPDIFRFEIQSQPTHEIDLPTIGTAKETIERHAVPFSQGVKQSNLKRGFRQGVTGADLMQRLQHRAGSFEIHAD